MERAGLLGGVKLRSLAPDTDTKLRGETLEQAIKEDLEAGLIPFYVRVKFLTFIPIFDSDFLINLDTALFK